jgi:hypothetical protein
LTGKSVTKLEFDSQLKSELAQVKNGFSQQLAPLTSGLDTKVELSEFTSKLQDFTSKLERTQKHLEDKVQSCCANAEKYCDNQLTFLSKRVDSELIKAQADTKSMISTTQHSQSRAAESFHSSAADVEGQVKLLM